jgi:nitric oxide dioxygenase
VKLTAHPLAESLPADAVKAAPMDQHLMLRLRVSLAQLLTKGDQLTTTFYALLFERYPAVRRLFPADMTQQRAKLAQALAWIVMRLDHREESIPALRELGRRHVAYGASPEHYPIVRDTLIDAMAHTAGSEWTDALAQDWRLSIDLVARHMLAATTSRVPR